MLTGPEGITPLQMMLQRQKWGGGGRKRKTGLIFVEISIKHWQELRLRVRKAELTLREVFDIHVLLEQAQISGAERSPRQP